MSDLQLSKPHQAIHDAFTTALSTYRSPYTVELRGYYLQRLMTWAQDTTEHGSVLRLTLEDFHTWLSKDVGPAISTKRSARSTLSVFYEWAETIGKIKKNPARKLSSMRNSVGIPNPCPTDDIQRALDRATRPIDVLMILFGELQGMRAGEISRAHSDDVMLPTKELRILGKGNKQRLVPLHPLMQELLPQFPTGYFFPSDRNPSGHMLPRSIGRRVRHLLGFQPGRNAHSLRHKFGVDALELNPDLMGLRDLLGHASVATTQIYTKASSSRLRKLVDDIPEPPGHRDRLQALKRGLMQG
ncbi:tyrosine-type recombinase/integrase [Brevibacterium aurantiacum]|uniref:tyrosine-type recombinase/integrase n=1 Tax=Brevibacterium aurantiacum TaxID=273384 RepID=UPI00084C8F23|nr:tyrosine-type recombinase/integrase [Brevibacterium aurantiacum]RCS95065.1 hypothetical protein CIK60_17515 [Brevibacterium aurantiacum]